MTEPMPIPRPAAAYLVLPSGPAEVLGVAMEPGPPGVERTCYRLRFPDGHVHHLLMEAARDYEVVSMATIRRRAAAYALAVAAEGAGA